MTTIPDWLFERPDLTPAQKWLYMCLVMVCESIPNKQYPIYAGTIEEIEQNTHAGGPIDPLSLFDLADKRLIRLTQTGDEVAISIVKQEAATSGGEHQEYTLYWHPSEMDTARLAYGSDTPLWGSERLEVKQGDQWIAGKVGHIVPGGGLVLWPRKGASDQEYITLTVGSRVRTVSEPVGDGGDPA